MPPVNDNRASAIDFGTATSASDTRDLSTATAEVGETEKIWNNPESTPTSVTPQRTAWWKWTCPSGVNQLKVRRTSASSSSSWAICVFHGTTAIGSSIISGSTTGQCTVDVTPGQTYHIQVDKRSPLGSGSVTVAITAATSAPGNDNIASATNVGSASTFSGDIFGATLESGESPGYVTNSPSSSGHTVWFKWTAPSGAIAVLFNIRTGTSHNIAIYGSADATLSPLIANFGRAGILCTAGDDLWIQVDYAVSSSPTEFNVDVTTYAAPTNDELANAIVIPPRGTDDSNQIQWTDATHWNMTATTEASEPIPSVGPGDGPWSTIWWHWKCPPLADPTVVVSLIAAGVCTKLASTRPILSSEVPDSYLDTVLGIYEGPAVGATMASLVEAASNDDSHSTVLSEVFFDPTPGVTYYIQVSSFSAPSGDRVADAYVTGLITLFVNGTLLPAGGWGRRRFGGAGF